jgi:hypothetical protein
MSAVHPNPKPVDGTAIPTDVRAALENLLADRHSPESKALFIHLAGYVDRRLLRVVRRRYDDLLSEAQREEIVGDVLFELMSSALAGFRGHTLGELTAYVRCICDRQAWRSAQKRIRERDALRDRSPGATAVRGWFSEVPAPDAHLRLSTENPFDSVDTEYLRALLQAGSRAELARARGVSRAAVTQRVQRIKGRIAQMSVQQQAAARSWFEREADKVASMRAL